MAPRPDRRKKHSAIFSAEDLARYRDELIISNKAGYYMWPGPYGEWGSRKYLIASCDQSLKRTGLDYVDIFYSHRPDPEHAAGRNNGRARLHRPQRPRPVCWHLHLFGPSRHGRRRASCKELGTPCLIHQPRYNMFDRWIEDGLLDVLEEEGIGCIPFSPLCQGILTNKYINKIPKESRAGKYDGELFWGDKVTARRVGKVIKLNEIAQDRGQTMAQLAIAWTLRLDTITSALIGASRPEQIDRCRRRPGQSRIEPGGTAGD